MAQLKQYIYVFSTWVNAIPTYNIYSNVTGAYGIFASYTSQISDTVKVNR